MSYSVPKVPHIFQKLPKKEKQRLIDLVPHRMKKTMRLYGVSPLVLLKTRAPNTGPTSKVDSFRKVKYKKDSINELYNELSGDSERSRLNGPEIAPNFGDADEFNTAEDIGLNADLSPEPSDMSSSLANLIEKDNVALDQDFTRDGLKGPEIEPSFGEIDEFEF